jgi:Asp-tRNA(Asn)/Glu-tRNA(Gln) amidotransferase B subunit
LNHLLNLLDISNDENTELIPIVTSENESDIVLVIKESTAKELVKTPEELAKMVEELLQENETKVTG